MKKKKIIFMLLFSTSLAASASQWIQYWAANDGHQSYFDKSSPPEWTGDTVKISVLYDFDDPVTLGNGRKKVTYLSGKTNILMDCKAKQYKIKSITAYSKNMGTGVVVLDDKKIEIDGSVVEHSEMDFWSKSACKK